jgi:hypothetical protein
MQCSNIHLWNFSYPYLSFTYFGSIFSLLLFIPSFLLCIKDILTPNAAHTPARLSPTRPTIYVPTWPPLIRPSPTSRPTPSTLPDLILLVYSYSSLSYSSFTLVFLPPAQFNPTRPNLLCSNLVPIYRYLPRPSKKCVCEVGVVWRGAAPAELNQAMVSCRLHLHRCIKLVFYFVVRNTSERSSLTSR